MRWKMKKFNFSLFMLAFVVVSLFFSCKDATVKESEKLSRVTNLPYFNSADFTPHWIDPSSKQLKKFHRVPDFELINQDSAIISGETFKDKIYVVDFFFTTCPGICPKMAESMVMVQEEFLEDSEVLILSHSVTPSIDSVPVLKEYAEGKGIVSNKWHLVTGDKKMIYDLGRYAYFVEEDMGVEKIEDDFLHTENFVLVDQQKHIRGIYNGLNKTSVTQLIADIKTLKKED